MRASGEAQGLKSLSWRCLSEVGSKTFILNRKFKTLNPKSSILDLNPKPYHGRTFVRLASREDLVCETLNSEDYYRGPDELCTRVWSGDL